MTHTQPIHTMTNAGGPGSHLDCTIGKKGVENREKKLCKQYCTIPSASPQKKKKKYAFESESTNVNVCLGSSESKNSLIILECLCTCYFEYMQFCILLGETEAIGFLKMM